MVIVGFADWFLPGIGVARNFICQLGQFPLVRIRWY